MRRHYLVCMAICAVNISLAQSEGANIESRESRDNIQYLDVRSLSDMIYGLNRNIPGLVESVMYRNIKEAGFDNEFISWKGFFNNRCLFGPIGCVLPAEYEEAFYRDQEVQAEVAGVN